MNEEIEDIDFTEVTEDEEERRKRKSDASLDLVKTISKVCHDESVDTICEALAMMLANTITIVPAGDLRDNLKHEHFDRLFEHFMRCIEGDGNHERQEAHQEPGAGDADPDTRDSGSATAGNLPVDAHREDDPLF